MTNEQLRKSLYNKNSGAWCNDSFCWKFFGKAIIPFSFFSVFLVAGKNPLKSIRFLTAFLRSFQRCFREKIAPFIPRRGVTLKIEDVLCKERLKCTVQCTGEVINLTELCTCADSPDLDATPLITAPARDLLVHPHTWQGHWPCWSLRMRRWSWTRCTATSHACTWSISRHVERTLIELCACAGDPELDAPLPATPARDLYPATWRGDQLRGELQDFYLHWDQVHRCHRIPEP